MSRPRQTDGGVTLARPTPRWSRTERLVLACLAAGILLSLPFCVHPWYDRTPDGSIYLITARSIAAGEGYSYLGAPFSVRPPGFSALLAPLVGARGTVSFAALNWMVALFGAAGVVLLYCHQRAHLGWVLALLTSCAIWLNPGYQRLCNQVMSDVPGLALLLAGLLLERWASRRPSWRREVLLGLAIGSSAYLRSTTILLVPAILAARLFRRRPPVGERRNWTAFIAQRLAIVAVVAWLVLVPWSVAKRGGAQPPPADQRLNYSLSTAMWHRDPGDPDSPRFTVAEILQRVPPRLRDLSLVLGSRMQHRIPGSPTPEAAVVVGRVLISLGMVACLLVVLARRRAPAEWFAALLLGVVALYFVFTERLILPVFVLALAATVEVLRDLIRRWAGPRKATVALAAALLLLIGVDFEPRQGWDAIEARHREFVAQASAVERVLAPDARLAAGQGFHHGVYLDRPVYNLMHAARRARDVASAEQVIDRYDLNTVVLSPLVMPDRAFVAYFNARYGRGTPADGALVWRVRP